MFDKLVTLTINGNENITNITEVTEILGSNFNEKWYDYAQGLKTHIYYDYDNQIKADFIYINQENSLVRAILSRTN